MPTEKEKAHVIDSVPATDATLLPPGEYKAQVETVFDGVAPARSGQRQRVLRMVFQVLYAGQAHQQTVMVTKVEE
jgi:hypothetical protein